MFYHSLQNTVSLHPQFRYMAYSSLQVPEGTNSFFLKIAIFKTKHCFCGNVNLCRHYYDIKYMCVSEQHTIS